jgi:nucleoside-diphosphate-sugar epimerase
VHVDSVVEAIVRALEAPADTVKSELFVISDGDDVSWADFYGHFAKALGMPVRESSVEQLQPGVSTDHGWLHRAATPLRSVRDVAQSPEMWALTKRMLKSEPVYSVGKWAMDTFPPVERVVKRSFEIDAPALYQRPSAASTMEPFLFELTQARVSIDKARRVLGIEPAYPRERAMALTLEWLRYARIVPNPS